ncbi:MAG: YqaJ-like viral recombinase [Marmoricola sp.]|nr:YqaJ-like viral recombinase [Marmoricola sp.]
MNAPFKIPGIVFHEEYEQGSLQWLAARCGLLTASEMDRIVTPTLKVASNDKERAHVAEIAAQRITQYVEPHYIGDEMLRGHEDEVRARLAYEKKYEPVKQVGFVTNSRWGFTIGVSPDGLVGDDGMIECKSRRQKFQIQTIADRAMPADFVIQVQTAMLVTERKWCDFISYSGGLPMVTIRVEPDPIVQDAIVEAAAKFEERVVAKIDLYHQALASDLRLIPTERVIEQEMY